MRLGSLSLQIGTGLACRRISTAPARSPSGIATDTRSPTIIAGLSHAHGLRLSGTSPDRKLVEMIELPGHPYFLGCQFHPELKSRPMAPHPLFVRFVSAALERASTAIRGAPAKAVVGEGTDSTDRTRHAGRPTRRIVRLCLAWLFVP